MLRGAFFQNAVLRRPERGFSKNFAGRAPRGRRRKARARSFCFFAFCGIPLLQGRARLQGGGCGKAPFQRGYFFSAGCAPAHAGRLWARPAAWFSAAGTAASPLWGAAERTRPCFSAGPIKKSGRGESPSRFSVFGDLAPPRGAQALYFRPIGSSRKMRASISRRSGEMAGRTAICAQISRSRSTPGAISVSSRPWAVRRNTARSVK